MSYKILEANGVDNENIDGGALNNLIVKDKSGIVNGVLSECALTATGSLIGISPGLLILHGIRVKITATETLTLVNVPATATKYQIVAQVVLSTDRSVSFSFLLQEPIALKQDELYATNEGTYQIEFGTFTQNTDGTISSLVRTVRTLYESETQMREDLDGALADIATLKTNVDGNEKGIAENAALIANNARNIAQNSAHIQNLFFIARANNQFAVLKTEQAYTTRQTANGAEIFDEQYTAVKEIKGSTVKTTNLIPFPYLFTEPKVVNGVTFTPQADGGIKVKGTSTAACVIDLNDTIAKGWNTSQKDTPVTVDGKYTLTGGKGDVFINLNASDGRAYLYISSANKTVDTVIYPMLVKAVYTSETMPSYIPYFTDLKHAFIHSIKSTGRNLIKFPYAFTTHTVNGITYTAQSDGGIKVTGTATATAVRSLNATPCRTIIASANGNASTGGGFTISGGKDNVVVALNASDGMAYMYVSANKTVDTIIYPKFQYASTDTEYEPYTEEIYQLPQELINLYPNGIPEYDRFIPQTGELIRQTGYATSETGFTEEEIAGYDGAIVSNDKLSLEYKLATPTIEKIENAPKLYKAWKHGSETVIQGETDNSIYGAMPTITNEYFTAVGAGEEEANE